MPRMSNLAARTLLDALTDLIDGGSIKIYTGSAPTNVEDTATGTLLATLTLGNPSFGSATDGTDKATADANSITGDSSADAAGTAGYFRALNSGGTAVIQGTVGTSGADINFDAIIWDVGDPINITSWTLTIGET